MYKEPTWVVDEDNKKIRKLIKTEEYKVNGKIKRKDIVLETQAIKPIWEEKQLSLMKKISRGKLMMIDTVRLDNVEELLDEPPKMALRLLNNDSNGNVRGFRKSILLPLDKSLIKSIIKLLEETLTKI